MTNPNAIGHWSLVIGHSPKGGKWVSANPAAAG
jgi:hypothetical protein